jgi:hypothetical protein
MSSGSLIGGIPRRKFSKWNVNSSLGSASIFNASAPSSHRRHAVPAEAVRPDDTGKEGKGDSGYEMIRTHQDIFSLHIQVMSRQVRKSKCPAILSICLPS